MKRKFTTLSMLMMFIYASGQSAGNTFYTTNTISGENTESITTAKPGLLERHRVWLNMTNDGGAFKQLLVGYIQGATNGYDSDFDGISLNANAFIDFYSINLGSNLVIQGRALPFVETDVVPLGYRTIISGEFKISIDRTDGVLASQRIFIKDKLTNEMHDLTISDYAFTTETGFFNDRFELRYTNTTLGPEDFKDVVEEVSIGIQDKILSIISTVENIDKILVYNISGQQLSRRENIRDTQLMIHDLPSAEQILLVKVFLENGKNFTKKTLLK